MSKSKNVIDPENIINNYRRSKTIYIIGSHEKDVQWSDQGMIASTIYSKL